MQVRLAPLAFFISLAVGLFAFIPFTPSMSPAFRLPPSSFILHPLQSSPERSEGAALPSSPTTRYVSCDYGADAGDCASPSAPCYTIQYAIGQASPGDSLALGQGTCAETVVITKTLALYGGYSPGFIVRAPHAYTTTLDGQNTHRVLVISGTAPVTLILDGLDIARGCPSPDGGHILVAGGGHTLNLNDCTVRDLADVGATLAHGGIYVGQGSRLNVTHSTLRDNTAGSNAYGSAIYLYNSSAIIADTTIAGSQDKGAVYALESSLALTRSRVVSNTIGLLIHSGPATSTISHSVFISNTTAINVEYGRAILSSNVFTRNTTAIVANAVAGLQSDNNVLVYNTTGLRLMGSEEAMPLPSPLINHNTLVSNTTGIHAAFCLTVYVTNTILADNAAALVAADPLSVIMADSLLLHANDADIGGAGRITLTHAYTGSPTLAAGGCHLTSRSAAIDRGIPTNLTHDFDSDPRSAGPAPDLGADETVPVTQVAVAGPRQGQLNTSYTFTASISPTAATLPIVYTWSPAPGRGQGTTTAIYTWTTSGAQVIAFSAANPVPVTRTHTITIIAPPGETPTPTGTPSATPTCEAPTDTPTPSATPADETPTSTAWPTANPTGTPFNPPIYLPIALKTLPAFTPTPTATATATPTPRPQIGSDTCPGELLAIPDYIAQEFEHADDRDWFAFDAQALVLYVIETGDLGSRADTRIELYDLDCGALLAQNDDIDYPRNVASRITWTAPAAGRYHILVRPYDWRVYGAGTNYTLRLREGAYWHSFDPNKSGQAGRPVGLALR